MCDVPILRDGPSDAPATVLLAHGAGAGMEHEFLAAFARGLAAAGLAVWRFEFPYMAARRDGRRPGPDRLPVLQATTKALAAEVRGPLALVGKSMGGRVATTVADELRAIACVAVGYPFHPPKKPEQLRTAHLATLRTQTLILQGERDPFGTPDEVGGYALGDAIEVRWFADGDHSLAPRKQSGFTAAQHLEAAIEAAASFVLTRC
ncbi:MAG: alpha/beta fold hydrolase [Planctomycetes bacterium]|nr:alpha/beta fold hydrolase [Planctomycetota bacterium]